MSEEFDYEPMTPIVDKDTKTAPNDKHEILLSHDEIEEDESDGDIF